MLPLELTFFIYAVNSGSYFFPIHGIPEAIKAAAGTGQGNTLICWTGECLMFYRHRRGKQLPDPGNICSTNPKLMIATSSLMAHSHPDAGNHQTATHNSSQLVTNTEEFIGAGSGLRVPAQLTFSTQPTLTCIPNAMMQFCAERTSFHWNENPMIYNLWH